MIILRPESVQVRNKLVLLDTWRPVLTYRQIKICRDTSQVFLAGKKGEATNRLLIAHKWAFVVSFNYNLVDSQNSLTHISSWFVQKPGKSPDTNVTTSGTKLPIIDRKQSARQQTIVNDNRCNQWQSIAIRGLELGIIDWSSIGR